MRLHTYSEIRPRHQKRLGTTALHEENSFFYFSLYHVVWLDFTNKLLVFFKCFFHLNGNIDRKNTEI